MSVKKIIGKLLLVTVIIPTWNRKETLLIAINSVLTQTYQNFEISVCDDGSTDESKDTVNNLNDARIRWISGNHSGCPAVPRNKGIREANGDFLAFLNGDDTWLPDKLASQLEIISQQEDCNTAITSNATIYNPSLDLETGCLYPDLFDNSHFSLYCLLQDNKVVTSSVLMHSFLQKKIGFFPESINVGYGSDITVKELAMLVSQAVGFEGAIEFDSSKPDGSPRKWMDSSDRLNALGWQAHVNLEKGLAIAYEDFKKSN